MAYKIDKDGVLLFTIGGKVQTKEEFDKRSGQGSHPSIRRLGKRLWPTSSNSTKRHCRPLKIFSGWSTACPRRAGRKNGLRPASPRRTSSSETNDKYQAPSSERAETEKLRGFGGKRDTDDPRTGTIFPPSRPGSSPGTLTCEAGALLSMTRRA